MSPLKIRAARWIGAASCLFVVFSLLSSAAAQDFTLQMQNFVPIAMIPGGQATATILLDPNTTFGSAVDLSCNVTTTVQNANPPSCVVSPTAVTPPGSATAIVSSLGVNGSGATSGSYTVTITGTGGGLTHTASKDVAVLTVTAQFTITVTAVAAPSSVPAGSGAQATISVNPISNYTGVVTLSCSSISPVVPNPPQCSFAYPTGNNGLPVNNVPATSILTISTVGPPKATVSRVSSRLFALWMPLPMLALLGIGAAGGKRSRKACGLFAVFVLAGSFLLLPACGNSNNNSSTTTTSTTETPANTYVFTLSGVDQNGVISSNTGTTNTAPTVSLTVTKP